MSIIIPENCTILNPVCYWPGFFTKDLEWAVVPYGSRFMLIHKGQQVQIANTISSAVNHVEKYLKEQKKNKSSATLNQYI
jgi:hypothetical protein